VNNRSKQDKSKIQHANKFFLYEENHDHAREIQFAADHIEQLFVWNSRILSKVRHIFWPYPLYRFFLWQSILQPIGSCQRHLLLHDLLFSS